MLKMFCDSSCLFFNRDHRQQIWLRFGSMDYVCWVGLLLETNTHNLLIWITPMCSKKCTGLWDNVYKNVEFLFEIWFSLLAMMGYAMESVWTTICPRKHEVWFRCRINAGPAVENIWYKTPNWSMIYTISSPAGQKKRDLPWQQS